jgi:NAD(P)-dependent dehydrogenase (short-subunit alcohol dehydrogenase family)
MPTFTEFVRDQRKTLPLVPTQDVVEGGTYIVGFPSPPKTFLGSNNLQVTGSNQGLGFECAKHLVQLSAKRLILAVRTLSKGETAKAKIETETGRKGVIEVWHLDLDSYDSVKDFAGKVHGLDRVDAVIENASIAAGKWTVSEGLETSLASNVVSNMLLAVLVLPKLQESAKKFGNSPHLVVVGSEVAFQAKGELERIDGEIFDGLGPETMNKR